METQQVSMRAKAARRTPGISKEKREELERKRIEELKKEQQEEPNRFNNIQIE